MYCHLQFFTVFVYLGCKIKNPWETSVGAQVILPGMKNLGALQWKTSAIHYQASWRPFRSPETTSRHDVVSLPGERLPFISQRRWTSGTLRSTPTYTTWPWERSVFPSHTHHPACLCLQVWGKNNTHMNFQLHKRNGLWEEQEVGAAVESATRNQRRLLVLRFLGEGWRFCALCKGQNLGFGDQVGLYGVWVQDKEIGTLRSRYLLLKICLNE